MTFPTAHEEHRASCLRGEKGGMLAFKAGFVAKHFVHCPLNSALASQLEQVPPSRTTQQAASQLR